MKSGNSNRLVASLLFFAFASLAVAEDDPAAISAFEAKHQQAVELARADQTEKGLAMLEALLAEQPNNYPVRRDYVIVLSWAGDCDAALEQYEIVRHRPVLDAYLYPPVSECFAALRDHDAALALLDEGMKAHPDDEDIKNTFAELQAEIKRESRPDYSVTAGTAESDAGIREWFMSARYSDEINSKARWYVRYFASQADDSEFATGDLSRLSVGVRYWLDPQWLLDQSFTRELDQDKQNGSQTGLTYFPNSRTQISAEYANNAEDVPLRAKAQGISVDRTVLSANYHTSGYVWELSGSTARYEFSDTNQRTSLFGSLGYGYMLKSNLEHRVIAEVSSSKNTLLSTDVDYFNPSKDSGITLVHRTSFVFDSAYDRHVDHLSVFAGSYNQEGVGARPVSGIRYQQEYSFSEVVSLGLSLEYASRVYDDERESQTSISVTMSGKFL